MPRRIHRRRTAGTPALLLVLLLVPVCCSPKSQVLRLTGPAPLPVETGHYPAYLEIMDGDSPLTRRSLAWRTDIESNEKVLRQLVRERFDLGKVPLEFRYMYTGLDSAANVAVVRYFAFQPNPIEIAGWEVFLVYLLPRGRLVRAYVAEVPLE